MGKQNSDRKGLAEAAVVTVVVAAVLIFVTWELASAPVPPDAGELQRRLESVSAELTSLRQRLARLQANQAVLERETDVLRRANELLRKSESARQAEMNQLHSELDFYRRLAGTGAAQSGLDIYRVEIVPTDSTRVYRFILTLTQNLQRASITSGTVTMRLEGTQGDQVVRLGWQQLGGPGAEPEFRFKYFQQIEGYLTLPEGFSPTRLLLKLEPAQKRKSVERVFEWSDALRTDGTPKH